MIEDVRELILGLCEGKDWDWKTHVQSVVKYSEVLAKQLDADVEVCVLAAWLHDIIKIRDNVRKLHHVKGAQEAAVILADLGYPKDKTEKVRHCILTHSSDKSYPPQTLEAKIVASADAMSHFDNFLLLAQVFLGIHQMPVEKARKELQDKYAAMWDKMMPVAQEMVRGKYDAIRIVVSTS